MARADLLINLVRAAVSGDKGRLKEVVEALAAEERAKRHDVLADRLIKALQGTGSVTLFPAERATPQQNSGRDFVSERQPRTSLSSLRLPDHVQQALSELVEENHRSDLLRSYGMQPRNRLLLAGPPGNGKTTVAEGLAEALGRPLLTVRYDALIGSYLGETNQRLRQLFEYVRSVPCVLLFDEFDAIGKERGDRQETGEIKRVVSSLLMEIDALPSYVLVVAATNHQELLDRAVWRRFQQRLELPAPTQDQIGDYLEQIFDIPPARWHSVAKDIRKVGLSNYAEASDFVDDVRRRSILSGGTTPVQDVIRERADQWSRRVLVTSSGDRPNETPAAVEHPYAKRAR
ncbi:AAA family ATPase [Brevundimonas nasdae]|uniref:AAA family ATPase n=1 Tax=Brevundimonas nasdae TaxID=172043 RepID=UPI00289F90CC|nr:ATP-binding protein [Brevundimonas nasdae]